MIFDSETAFQPWISDWPTLDELSLFAAAPFGISLIPNIVHAAKRNEIALI